METDPKECRVYAARCEELAKTADKPERARVLRNLSKQWIKLADELERAQRLLNDPRPSCGSHLKYVTNRSQPRQMWSHRPALCQVGNIRFSNSAR
jgi:uncharacterized protein YbbK (DUF523 family)